MKIRQTLSNALFFAGFMTCAFLFSTQSNAQLAGTDITPSSSCAGYPTGAVTMTADADTNGQAVILICTGGGTWEVDSSGGGGSGLWSDSGNGYIEYDSASYGGILVGGQTGLAAPAMP